MPWAMHLVLSSWQRCIAPPVWVRDAQRRRRIQLLSGLLVALMLLGVVAVSLQVWLRPHYEATVAVIFSGIGALALAYALVRRGYYASSALLTVLVPASACFVIIVVSPGEVFVYASLSLSLILAAILLDTRGMLFITAASLFGLFVLLALDVEPPGGDPAGAPLFLVIVSSLLLLSRRHAFQLERERQAELAASEAQFRAFFEQAAVGVAQIETATGRLLRINRRYAEMLGYTVQEMLGRSFHDITHGDDRAETLHQMQRLLAGEIRAFSQEKRYCCKDGTVVWVALNVSPMWAAGETPHTHLAVAQDITERKQSEAALRNSENRYRTIVETAQEGIWQIDAESKTTFVNQKMAEMLGYTVEEMQGCSLLAFMDDEGREMVAQNVERRRQGIAEQHEFKFLRKPGGVVWTLLSTLPLFDSAGTYAGAFAMVTDISDRKQSENQLQHMAQHDALTGLPNRSLLIDRLNQAIARARWNKRIVALLFVDLDRFKTINDTLGHEAGDLLLQQLASRFQQHVREGDTVARFGGDEFVILLADVANEGDIRSITKKVLEALEPAFEIAERVLYITASIGVSLYPNDGEHATALLKNADIAMYRAKELGKNTYQFYSADMSARAFERLALESSLRHALECGELRVHYQPVIDLESGTISGMEALLRWQHPDFGLVLPSDFIGLLEETGLIVPAGEWVLETACEQLAEWHAAGWPNLRMAVNLSPRQLQSVALIPTLNRCLEKRAFQAGQIELEITEGMLMQHGHATTDMLGELRALGIRLAIDDFGTGYSSLSYLRRFPIDTLKIDRSFVRDIPGDPDDSAITTAIIALAQSLRLHVVAEGVETEAQRDFLLHLGCHLMQGYLFSKPLPAEEFARLLVLRNPRQA